MESKHIWIHRSMVVEIFCQGSNLPPMKFIFKHIWFLIVYLDLDLHNLYTIGPLIIPLVPDYSQCSDKHPQLSISLFSDAKNNWWNVIGIVKTQLMLILYHNKWLALNLLCGVWSNCSLSTLTKFKGGCNWYTTKNICCSFPLYIVIKSNEAVVEPIWLQTKIGTWYVMFWFILLWTTWCPCMHGYSLE